MTRALAALALVAAAATARADTPIPAQPRKIAVGVYVNQIFAVDIKANQFQIDFYIWFRWEGADDIKPLDTFEVNNGRIAAKTGIIKHTYGTQQYVSCRVLATITKFWDLHRFPLDDHTLELRIEDSDLDARQAVYVADVDNATVSPDLKVPGWVIGEHRSRVVTQTYHTNYGDITMPSNTESHWSRYVFAVEIERSGYGRFLRVFFGLFISALVAYCSFHVRPKESSPRVSLGVGATFAAAAVTVAINNSLPDTNSVTMADKLIMLTLGVIVATVGETIAALTLFARGKEDLQKKLDRTFAIGFPIFYVGMLALILVT